MSPLGDRLRRLAGRDRPLFRGADSAADRGLKNGLVLAAVAADEAEALALANSAEGRGPHAALALRWAADRLQEQDRADAGSAVLRSWAERAELR